MSSTCPKCGSGNVVPDARVEEQRPVSVCVDAAPQAVLFRGTVSAPLLARVCGDCGHVELWVRNPQPLLEAHCKSLAAEQRPTTP
jgi:hypothetical protein